MTDYLSQLPFFLKDYVYRNQWTGFRDVQIEAFKVLFETDNHLLLSAGTSGGKTEAAMFPVISSLYEDPPNGIGALYISPLKALIDDQFERLEDILKESEIQIHSWHGDISQSVKAGVRENPSGILQITPESIQALLLTHYSDIKTMFSELRFIIIDEVHTFLGSDRGLQLLCLLNSINRIAGCNPRRIGLSATLSNMGSAAEWLGADTGIPVSSVSLGSEAKGVIGVHYNWFPAEKNAEKERELSIIEYYKTLFKETQPYNCIVFVNSRSSAENTTNSLKIINKGVGDNKQIDIHHGSISKEIRKNSETRLKHGSDKTTLVATTTMELGIDVGDLERIVQINPPYSSSSFVQRMGRSGRRTGVPVMVIMAITDEDNKHDLPMGLDINLLKSIALVELYSKEHWVEPVRINSMPFGLLFQQTLAYIGTGFGVTFADIRRDVGNQYPFRNISESDHVILLKYMMEKGFIEVIGKGEFVISDMGSKFIKKPDFYATFTDDNLYEVRYNGKKIGFLPQVPPKGKIISLAGKMWNVLGEKAGIILVDATHQEGETNWNSGLPEIHTHVMETICNVLKNESIEEYLDDDASSCLENNRSEAKYRGLFNLYSSSEPNIYDIHPWLGSVQFDTFLRLLKRINGVVIKEVTEPFEVKIYSELNISFIFNQINNLKDSIKPFDLLNKNDKLVSDKFDRFVPKELLEKKFLENKIDLDFKINGSG